MRAWRVKRWTWLKLKGDNKQQGNWGEVVLARVLADSDFEGHEYQTRVNLQKRYPASVTNRMWSCICPQDKQVVVDSKISGTGWHSKGATSNAETDQQRDIALRDHLASLRAHIKGLSQKSYHQLKRHTEPWLCIDVYSGRTCVSKSRFKLIWFVKDAMEQTLS